MDDASLDAPRNTSSSRIRRRATVLAAVIIIGAIAGVGLWTVVDRDPHPTQMLSSYCPTQSNSGTQTDIPPQFLRNVLRDELTREWGQFELPASHSDASRFTTTADGRVAAEVWGERGDMLLVTDDGINWDEISLPDGLGLEGYHIGPDRWVIAGFPKDERTNSTAQWTPDEVFMSDDQGETWTEVPVDSDTPPFIREQHLTSFGFMVSGERIAMLASVFPVPVWSELLVDRGAATETDSIQFGYFDKDDLSFWVSREVPGQESDWIRFTFEELDISDRQRSLMETWWSYQVSYQLGLVRAYAGDEHGLTVMSTDLVDGSVVVMG